MLPRILTLRYVDRIDGFSEEPIRIASYGREILDASCQLFMHGDQPRALVFLKLSNYMGKVSSSRADGKATKAEATELKLLEEKIRPDDRKVQQKLKEWRNDKIKLEKLKMDKDCLPHNIDIARLVLAAPLTPDDMKQVKGIPEEMCERWAGDILNILSEINRPEEGIKPDQASGDEK